MIDYLIAKSMSGVFDALYKLGVKHAHEASSRDDLLKFLDETSHPDVYGFVTDAKTYDYYRWRGNLFFLGAENNMTSMRRMCDFMMEAYERNTVDGVFYPMSHKFYVRGVIHGMEHPLANGMMSKFMSMPHVSLPRFVQDLSDCHVSIRDYITLVQCYAYELCDSINALAKQDCAASKKLPKSKVSATKCVKFAEAFWRVVRAHSSARRLSEAQKAEEIARRERTARQLGLSDEYDEEQGFDGLPHSGEL